MFNILGQTGAANNFLNDSVPAARWKGNLMITWAKGGFSLTPSMRFVGSGKLNYAGVTPDQPELYQKVADGDPSVAGYGYVLLPFNRVPSYFLFNLNATYSFYNIPGVQNLSFFAQVNNIFNRTPPFASSPGGFNTSYAGTNPIYFDTLGLATRVGFRVKF